MRQLMTDDTLLPNTRQLPAFGVIQHDGQTYIYTRDAIGALQVRIFGGDVVPAGPLQAAIDADIAHQAAKRQGLSG